MLNRKVVTRYWCSTCNYSFEDNGVTPRPNKILDTRIVEAVTGKQLDATAKLKLQYQLADGQVSQVSDRCPRHHIVHDKSYE